jgi:hypothetical protein
MHLDHVQKDGGVRGGVDLHVAVVVAVAGY